MFEKALRALLVFVKTTLTYKFFIVFYTLIVLFNILYIDLRLTQSPIAIKHCFYYLLIDFIALYAHFKGINSIHIPQNVVSLPIEETIPKKEEEKEEVKEEPKKELGKKKEEVVVKKPPYITWETVYFLLSSAYITSLTFYLFIKIV